MRNVTTYTGVVCILAIISGVIWLACSNLGGPASPMVETDVAQRSAPGSSMEGSSGGLERIFSHLEGSGTQSSGSVEGIGVQVALSDVDAGYIRGHVSNRTGESRTITLGVFEIRGGLNYYIGHITKTWEAGGQTFPVTFQSACGARYQADFFWGDKLPLEPFPQEAQVFQLVNNLVVPFYVFETQDCTPPPPSCPNPPCGPPPPNCPLPPADEFCLDRPIGNPRQECGRYDLRPDGKDEDLEGTSYVLPRGADLVVVKAGKCYRLYPQATVGQTVIGPAGKDISHVTYCRCVFGDDDSSYDVQNP